MPNTWLAQLQRRFELTQLKRLAPKCTVVLLILIFASVVSNFWILPRQDDKLSSQHQPSLPKRRKLNPLRRQRHSQLDKQGNDADSLTKKSKESFAKHPKKAQEQKGKSNSQTHKNNASQGPYPRLKPANDATLSDRQKQQQQYQEAQVVYKTQQEIQNRAAEILQQRRRHSKTTERGNDASNTTNEEYMTACLLLKDDNDLLSEWIAYHYHALKMRHVMVALDPSSQTSPMGIFQSWANLTNLTFSIWTDDVYMPAFFLKNGYVVPPQLIKTAANESKWHEGHESPQQVLADKMRIANHRFRQKTFLAHCIRNLKANHGTWLMHIDTDEFVVVNPFLRSANISYESSSLLEYIPTTPAPPNTLFLFLQQLVAQGEAKNLNYPCISMPRLQFGAVEDDKPLDAHQATRQLDNHWNLSTFETLRWKYHTNYTDAERNGQPKVILDVSQVPPNDKMMGAKVFSIHRPSLTLCRNKDQMDFTSTRRYPLTVNHYMGSWERYSARNDSRRSYRVSRALVVDGLFLACGTHPEWLYCWLNVARKAYKTNANLRNGRDDWLKDWLSGFERVHGTRLASQLLGKRYSQDRKTSTALDIRI